MTPMGRRRVSASAMEHRDDDIPTGTCDAWLEAGGTPRGEGRIVQECAAGLVEVRSTPDGLAFAAPPLVRSGPVDEPVVEHVAELLGIARGEIVDAEWVDNGPGWVGV